MPQRKYYAPYEEPTADDLARLAQQHGAVVLPVLPEQWERATRDGFELFSRSLKDGYSDYSGLGRHWSYVKVKNDLELSIVGEEVVAKYLGGERTPMEMYRENGDILWRGHSIHVKTNLRGTDLGITELETALYSRRPVVLVVPRVCHELRMEVILPGWIWADEALEKAHTTTRQKVHYVPPPYLLPMGELLELPEKER